MKRRHLTIAHTIAAATTEQLKEWIDQGKLKPGRVAKNGRLVSLTFNRGDGKQPRHIRLDTLQLLAARAAAARQKPHMPPMIQG
jgi:hypothetical protein